jgi:hypothetical protein
MPMPVEIFDLDGEEHEVGPDCCSSEGQCTCGGNLHFQGIYGGYIRVCEECNREDLNIKVKDEEEGSNTLQSIK